MNLLFIVEKITIGNDIVKAEKQNTRSSDMRKAFFDTCQNKKKNNVKLNEK